MKNNQQTQNRKVTPVERFFSKSPFAIITMVARINGNVSEDALRKAVAMARKKHIALNYRIVEDENNQMWFTTDGAGETSIKVFPRKNENDWISISQESNKVPFQFETLPSFRFTLVYSLEISELIISCHHIICDGLSMAYLTKDILSYLGDPNQRVETLPEMPPITLDNMPKEMKMNGLIKFVMNRMGKKWNDVGISFDQEDYEVSTEAYWKNLNHNLVSIELSESETINLVEKCRKEKVTVNSALTTAFSSAQNLIEGLEDNHPRIAVAADLRNRITDTVGEGIGIYAGGVDLKFTYKKELGFWDNTRNFHKQITPIYINKNLFKETLTWSHLESTIYEALNFKKIGGIVDSDSTRYEKLNSFSKSDDVILSLLKREGMEDFEKVFLGTAITNLTRLDFPKTYGDLELDRIIFKPGGAFSMANVNLLVGAVTCSGKLSILIEYSDKNFNQTEMEQVKDKALSLLVGK